MFEDPAKAALTAATWLRDEVLPLAAGRQQLPPDVANEILSVLGPAIAKAPPKMQAKHQQELAAALYGCRVVTIREDDAIALVACLEQCARRLDEVESDIWPSTESNSRYLQRLARQMARSSGATTPAQRATEPGGS